MVKHWSILGIQEGIAWRIIDSGENTLVPGGKLEESDELYGIEKPL